MKQADMCAPIRYNNASVGIGHVAPQTDCIRCVAKIRLLCIFYTVSQKHHPF